jgi:uncharacterized membrane protein
MSLYLLLKFLHIGSAIAFVGGILARQLARSVAERSEDPREIALGFRIADPIEKFMVIPGSTLVILIGAALAIVTGAPILGFLQGASRNWLLVANVLILGIVALVPTVFLPRGKVFGERLEEAIRRGQVTPELRASMRDPVVRLSHTAELVATILVVVLMVFRPF